MELDGIGEGAGEGGGGIVEEDSGCFEDGYGAAAVIVGAGRGQDGWEEEVYAVLVRADDDSLVALAWDAEDDGGLAPGMGECGDGCVGAGLLIVCRW